MKNQNIEELIQLVLLEKGLRELEKAVWTTKNGEQIPIKNLSDKHIDNIIYKFRYLLEMKNIIEEHQFDIF